MPKVTNTRKQRAKELFARLKRGPLLSTTTFGEIILTALEEHYRCWFQSWNETELLDLIPELRSQDREQMEKP